MPHSKEHKDHNLLASVFATIYPLYLKIAPPIPNHSKKVFVEGKRCVDSVERRRKIVLTNAKNGVCRRLYLHWIEVSTNAVFGVSQDYLPSTLNAINTIFSFNEYFFSINIGTM